MAIAADSLLTALVAERRTPRRPYGTHGGTHTEQTLKTEPLGHGTHAEPM